tara:strand:+ start:1375 stop:2187 length:813 start_codon:yes stop_codon:yes gene_type:complete
MGLLEKAGNIQKEDEKPETKIVSPPVEKAKAKPTPKPEPQPKKKPVKAKKERPKKEKKPKKPKAPRVKKEMPEGFEAATRGQKLIRRVSDFLVSYGWMIPLLAITAWGSNFNPTIFMFLGIGLMIFNLWFMPSYAGQRTVGNWISRTRYINSRGESPIWIYLLIKGLTFPIVIIGVITIFTITSELPSSTGGQIFSAIGVLLLFPPLIDYAMYRLRGELGLWDTIFGGVWLVRTTKSKQTKGWLKRLESISDWTESKGLLDDQDTNEESK